MVNSIVMQTERGLYCEAGDFYIDPWQPVERAIITHAHSDHAVPGCANYLTSAEGERLCRLRLGNEARIESLSYGRQIDIDGVSVSLHPAGHILGSSQIRLEYKGQVWVVSGDYKLRNDPTCSRFEIVRCHSFVTEATFGLPIYRWPPPESVIEEVNNWWRGNQETGRASLLLAYSMGKAQRILKSVDSGIGPIYTHGAVEKVVDEYRAVGVALPATTPVTEATKKPDWTKALIIAPPTSKGTPWTRRFGIHSTAFASGWMSIRGARRRQALDRGFVLSDHADWEELLTAIRATGAEQVWVTHGYVPVLTRFLREELALDARELRTQHEGEGE
ncbi:MAG: ligase-associated DNA damage response exonuclease [Blastocatellia bacterium]|nr:ligase-associated DNA damage response exonuclease [Blastocatellia bacterium]